jgi:hypothetical protein
VGGAAPKAGPTREVLQALIKVLIGLRDNFKALINANLASWDSGHAKKDN